MAMRLPDPKTPFETFLHKCQTILDAAEVGGGSLYKNWYRGGNPYRDETITPHEDPRLYVEWTTGGVTGGSCWGNEGAGQPIGGDTPEELTALDAILEGLCPQITFLQYKGIYRETVTTDTFSREMGYYGGEYFKASLEVKMHKLYEVLKTRGLLPEEML